MQRKPENILLSESNIVAIFTAVSILQKMRKTLGLEAMLEYMEKYIQVTGDKNPDIKDAVAKAISLMSIEKIYREAFSCDKP